VGHNLSRPPGCQALNSMTYVRGSAPPLVVAVIGGGFSGLLSAIHLLRSGVNVQVRLVERAPLIGRGRAYRTTHPDHLLNVRASNMSAFPNRPAHFQAWLAEQGRDEGPDSFVSRGLYGDYLQGLLTQEMSVPGRADRLVLEQDEAISVDRIGGCWRVALASGRRFEANAVILALGLTPPDPPPGADAQTLASPNYIRDPWAIDLAMAPKGDVLLIGSGLTMVDVALSLAGGDRRLLAVSRRGLLSLSHAPVQPHPPPQGAMHSPTLALATLRAYAHEIGWREAVDSIRPCIASFWQSWSLAERRRFLRHLQPWWDVHRHRMAPQTAARVAQLAAAGQLTLIAGRIEDLRREGPGFEARIRRRRALIQETRRFAAVVNCAAPRPDAAAPPLGLLADLCRKGLARRDPLQLGLDVDDALRVVSAQGNATPSLFALGPLTRGAVWEATAVPDLRNQVAQVAKRVLVHLRQIAGVDLRAGVL
jgi:uncharacterized NAD(P)/FAD-binding protein YdhS